MNREDKSTLIALCLGDGYISPTGQLHITHSANQKEYCHWKMEKLNRICVGKRKSKLTFKKRFDKRTKKTYYSIVVTKQHKYFRILRKWLYKPEKRYSKFLLNKLTPSGIAIWFMDDGNLRKRVSKRTGKTSSIQVSLYTHCSKDQAKLVRDYFLKKYDIEFKLYKHKDLFYLCANTKNGLKFIDLIKDHININSMMYKVNLDSKSARPSKEVKI